MEPSTSFVAFVKAVVEQWATLMTGGVIVAALAVWERFRRPVPRKLYAAIVISALIVAFYQTWADEKQRNIKLSQALDAQQLQITDLKLKKYTGSTKYSLDGLITNTGPQATSTPISVKHHPIYTNSELPEEEIEKIMDELEDEAKSKPIPRSNLKNLIYPAKPITITIAEDFLTEEQITQINSGKLAVYVFAILKYRDKTLTQNHSRGTKYSAYFAGGIDYWHNIFNEVVDWDR